MNARRVFLLQKGLPRTETQVLAGKRIIVFAFNWRILEMCIGNNTWTHHIVSHRIVTYRIIGTGMRSLYPTSVTFREGGFVWTIFGSSDLQFLQALHLELNSKLNSGGRRPKSFSTPFTTMECKSADFEIIRPGWVRVENIALGVGTFASFPVAYFMWNMEKDVFFMKISWIFALCE